MGKNRIIVIGSCNTDMTIYADRLPKPGETVLGGSFKMFSGGKGGNQAVATARLGGEVSFVAKVGNDIFGEQVLEQYDKEGIDTRFILSDSHMPTGVALITVDQKGENCISVASGANAELKPADIEQVGELFNMSEILLLQLEIPIETVTYAARLAFDKGVKVILNPAPMASLPDQLFQCLYAIIPNKIEAEALSGIEIKDRSSARKAADVITGKGVDIVIITLGDEGALVKEGNCYYDIAADKVEVVDTTAAGDTFCGALCVALSEGQSIEDAAVFASCAAGISVSRLGAQSSIPYRRELVPVGKNRTIDSYQS